MRALVLLALLTACTDDVEPMPMPEPEKPCVLEQGSTCEAAYLYADVHCSHVEMCWPEIATETCRDDAVAAACERYDCEAPYTNLGELGVCLDAYAAQQCVTLGPPIMCSL